MPPFTVERNRIDYTSGTFDFVSTTIKFRPNVMAAADYICTLHEDAIEILLVSTPPTSTTGKIYNHSGKIKWNGEGLAYDSEVVHNNAIGEINALDNKAIPVAADVLLIEDSETTYSKKNILLSDLPGGSGTDDDAIHDNVSAEISVIGAKTTPIGADYLLIEDSEESASKKRITISQLPTGSDADAIHDNVSGEINAIGDEKTTLAVGDMILIEDSATSYSKKKAVIGNLPSTDSDAIHDNVDGEINAITLAKEIPVSGDLIIIEDSVDSYAKKKVEIGNLPGGSGTDTDAIHDNVAGEIADITEKTTPINTDLVVIEDSDDSNNKKRVQLGNLPGGSSNVIFDKTIATATNIVEIPGLEGLTRATMYLDHYNAGSVLAELQLFVNNETTENEYDAIYLLGNGSAASSYRSDDANICNTAIGKTSQATIEMSVINGRFYARAVITREATVDGRPEVVIREVRRVAADVTDLRGLSLNGATNAFGVGSRIIVYNPLVAGSASNVLYRETVTVEKQTINIGNLAGKKSAKIYLKHKAGGTGDKNVRIYVNGDTDNGDYEGVTWGAGYGPSTIASPSISNCISGATNTVTIDVEINNGVVYMTGYERRRSEAAQAVLIRHIFYDTEVVTDLSQLQLVAADSDGFGVGTEITVVDPYAAVREDRKIAIFEDQQTAGLEDSATAGSYFIRKLSATVNAAPGITLDGSNQITLMKGHKYHVRYEVPAYKVGRCKSRLYNVTTPGVEHVGATGYSNSTVTGSHAYCNGDCVVDLTEASTDEVFTVQLSVEYTNALNGCGVAADLGEPEVYTRVVVERL